MIVCVRVWWARPAPFRNAVLTDDNVLRVCCSLASNLSSGGVWIPGVGGNCH